MISVFVAAVALIGFFHLGKPAVPVGASTVVITVFDKDGAKQSLGSGVVIENGVVITARHVVHEAYAIEIETPSGQKYTHSEVLWEDEAHDIAAIQLVAWATDAPQSALACSYAPHIGDEIEIVGNPLGFRFLHSWGRVASILLHSPKLNDVWADVFAVDATIIPGNSGGPVYNNRGEVIAIAVGVALVPLNMMSVSMSGLGFVVPASTVCGLLKQHEATS